MHGLKHRLSHPDEPFAADGRGLAAVRFLRDRGVEVTGGILGNDPHPHLDHPPHPPPSPLPGAPLAHLSRVHLYRHRLLGLRPDHPRDCLFWVDGGRSRDRPAVVPWGGGFTRDGGCGLRATRTRMLLPRQVRHSGTLASDFPSARGGGFGAAFFGFVECVWERVLSSEVRDEVRVWCLWPVGY
ncbi:hypothetical protein EYC84_000524 [Monilinia fructicola]|uniref:Uncharacterized protein n=1 Tax=Monilinia fructicola TaxID=38448 RepID=A0A5M9JTK5_MONFR|nr:hypothetical protein EYC84_000524 [Monilinia fructicola]